MNIIYDHIKQLKYLPKHSQELSDDELDALKRKLEGINISGIEDIPEAFENISGAIKIATRDGSIFTDMLGKLTTKSIATQTGITAVLGVQQKLGTQATSAVKQITKLEQAFGFLNKRYGLTRKGSGEVATGFANIAKATDTDIDKIQKYAAALQDFIPLQTFALSDSTDTGTKSLFQLSDMLSKNLQLTDAQTEGYLRFNASQNALGISAVEAGEAVADAFAEGDPEKKAMFFKQIAEEIGSAGATARIQYGRTAGSLEKAVLQSRKLGISLADVNNAGRKMLDIESSVGQELEYQLLTGNRLIDQSGKSLTAEMRKATISGNASKQAEIMSTIMEQEGDTLRNNLFAREQMAAMLGLSEEKLAGMLEKQKFISQYGLDDADVNLSTDELQKKLIDAVKSDKALTEDQMKQQIDAIKASADKMDTRTTAEENQDIFKAIETNTLAMAAASFGGEEGLAKIFEDSTKGAQNISGPIETLVSSLGAIVESEGATQTLGVADNLSFTADKFSGVIDKLADLLPVGGDAVKTAVSTVKTAGKITEFDPTRLGGGTTTPADGTTVTKETLPDGFVPAAAGSKTLRLREGSLRIRDIQLNDNDDVIAGTNLFGESTQPASPNIAPQQQLATTTQPAQDPINYEKLAAAMAKVTINATVDGLYQSTPMGNNTFMT